MATRRQRRPGEREDDAEKQGEDDEEQTPAASPIDVDTIAALRAADPNTRKFSLLRIQRLHGNATVQRLMRELESTDATRDGRIQQIGERADEPAPSGKLEKAIVYRSSMEAEIERAPTDAKTEMEIVQDDVNTIGQIFANYQAAIHMFEAEIGRDPATESVPHEIVSEFLDDFTSQFFGDIVEVDLDAIPFLATMVERGVGAAEEPAEELRQEKGDGLPTTALRNLAVAERYRLASEHRDMIKLQTMMMKGATEQMSTIDPDRRNEQREELARISSELNDMESTTHSAQWFFRQILDAWKDEIRDTSWVQVEIDEQWAVRRARIRGREGKRLASELLADNSGSISLNDLKLARRVLIRPAELAEIEVEMGPDGSIRAVKRNEKAAQYVEDVTRRLRTEGLPDVRNLSGD